jgi:hypothetical protein
MRNRLSHLHAKKVAIPFLFDWGFLLAARPARLFAPVPGCTRRTVPPLPFSPTWLLTKLMTAMNFVEI